MHHARRATIALFAAALIVSACGTGDADLYVRHGAAPRPDGDAARAFAACPGDMHPLGDWQPRPGDVIGVRGKSQGLQVVKEAVGGKSDVRKFSWLEFNADKLQGKFLEYPERDQIPEKINEQLIVELYSK